MKEFFRIVLKGIGNILIAIGILLFAFNLINLY